MVDLSALIQAAHGGDAVNSIAAKFGLTPEQASAAINALTPALAQGLQNHMQSSEGLSQILGHLTDPTHAASYTDPNAAQTPQAAAAGTDILHQIFGNSAAVSQITQHIGAETGIDPAVLSQLAPVISSMAAGGVAKSLQENGLGNLLSQASGALGQGGLGGLLSSALSAATAPAAQGGGFGGVIGVVVGSLFGGRSAAPAAGAPAAGAPAQGGLDPALVQAGVSALGNLFQSGQASGALQAVLGQILAKR